MKNVIQPRKFLEKLKKLSPVKLSEITAQVTTDPNTGQPIIGGALSFQPKDKSTGKTEKSEVEYLEEFLIDLNRRTVLYEDPEWEHIDHTVESVLKIREDLIEIMKQVKSKSLLYSYLEHLAETCEEYRKLTYKIEQTESGFYKHGTENYAKLDKALHYLRSNFSKWLTIITIQYEVPIGEQVAQVIELSPNHLPELLERRYE
jgi:hypothetical protein